MRVFVAAGTIVLLAVTPVALRAQQAPAAPESTPTPEPSPTPRPAARSRLKLDIGRHIDDVLKRRDDSDVPRFEDRIEVTDRSQEALDAMLRGLDLACSPSESGPPPTSELNAMRTVPIPPYADFVAAAKAILKGLRKANPWKGAPDWFLYAVRRGEQRRLVVRKGELPASQRLAVQGTTWDEIARFDSSNEATAALRRLERGFATLARLTPGEPPHPYAPIKCLPPGLGPSKP